MYTVSSKGKLSSSVQFKEKLFIFGVRNINSVDRIIYK